VEDLNTMKKALVSKGMLQPGITKAEHRMRISGYIIEQGLVECGRILHGSTEAEIGAP